MKKEYTLQEKISYFEEQAEYTQALMIVTMNRLEKRYRFLTEKVLALQELELAEKTPKGEKES